MRIILLFTFFAISIYTFSNNTKKDSLYSEINKATTDASKAMLYKQYAQLFVLSDIDSAFFYNSKGFSLIDSNTFPAYADLSGQLGVIYFYKNNMDSFLFYSQKRYKIALFHKDTIRMINSLMNVAIATNSKGNSSESLSSFLKVDTLLGSKNSEMKAHNNIELSNVYLTIGHLDLALERALDAVKYYTEHNDTASIVMANIALANIYSLLGDNEKAISTYNYCRINNAKLKTKYISDEALLSNIGYLYMNNNYNLDSALIIFSRLLHSIEDKDGYYMCKVYVNMGVTYYKLGDLNSAIYYYRKAVNNKNASSRKNILNAVYINIGQYYINIDNDSAYFYLNKGVEVSKELGNKPFLKNAYANLIKLDSIEGNLKLMAKDIQLYYKIVLEINNTQSQEQISKLKSVQELENKKIENSLLSIEKKLQKKELERKTFINYALILGIILIGLFLVIIIISNKKVRILNKELMLKSDFVNKQNKLLDQSNKDKDMFLRIIAHDLKNPIGGILAYSEQVNQMVDDMSKEEINNVFNTIYKSADNTFNLLNDLLIWGKAQSANFVVKNEDINIKSFIISMHDVAARQLKAKDINLIIEDVDDNMSINSDKNILDTIIRNYISNAIKYSYNGGVINISFENTDNKFKVLIKDNGIGIPNNVLPKIFSEDFEYGTKGTNNEETNGLGLKIVSTLAKKINADVGVESELEKGSVFWLEIKTDGNYIV